MFGAMKEAGFEPSLSFFEFFHCAKDGIVVPVLK